MSIILNGSSGIQFPNFIENEQSIDADYTVAATKNAASIGDIEISSGVTVTVTSGGNWVIL
jgi:hypothetical protein|tara:strand:+ start:1077 stop:1259 length:183 start_codon:yes stop_codon:yes gene_type:complete